MLNCGSLPFVGLCPRQSLPARPIVPCGQHVLAAAIHWSSMSSLHHDVENQFVGYLHIWCLGSDCVRYLVL